MDRLNLWLWLLALAAVALGYRVAFDLARRLALSDMPALVEGPQRMTTEW